VLLLVTDKIRCQRKRWYTLPSLWFFMEERYTKRWSSSPCVNK